MVVNYSNTSRVVVKTQPKKTVFVFTLSRPAKRLKACGFAREFPQSGILHRPSKSLKKRS